MYNLKMHLQNLEHIIIKDINNNDFFIYNNSKIVNFELLSLLQQISNIIYISFYNNWNLSLKRMNIYLS